MTDSVFWILNSVATMVTAALAIALVMPRVMLLSDRRELFDMPSGRKIHRDPVSRLGGIVFFPVMVFAMLVVLAVNMLAGSLALGEALIALPRQSVCAACGMLLLYFTGLRDDLTALSPWTKLAVQVAVGALLAFSGCRLGVFSGFLGLESVGDVPAIILTVCATVLIINAINFIDGVDGLASAMCGVCFVWQVVMSAIGGAYGNVIWGMSGLGVAVAFLYFNMRGIRGKRIFMGDTGSLTLGFLATWLAFKIDGIVAPLPVSGFIAVITPLMVPCLDALRVVLTRLLRGDNPLMADASHLHHILYRGGGSAPRVTMGLVALSAAIMMLNILLSPWCGASVIIGADVVLFSLFVFIAPRTPRWCNS